MTADRGSGVKIAGLMPVHGRSSPVPSPASVPSSSDLPAGPLDLPPHARDIYVISPSGAIADRSRVQRARRLLQRQGFRLTLDPKALATHQQRFAGDDEMRLQAFQRAMESNAPTLFVSIL